MEIVMYGKPITKKNHQQIIYVKGRPLIIQSSAYRKYEKDCKKYIPKIEKVINERINLKCVYYMPTKHKVDLCNLLGATCDILVKHKILEDDNCNIVVSHDGSVVLYDKEKPRVEVEIRRLENEI